LGNYGPGFQIYFNTGAGAFTLTGNAINFYDYNGVNPLIQNDSTNLQTVTFQIDTENDMSLNANSGSMAFTGSFYLDNNTTLTANAASNQTITFSGSINNGSGSTGRVTIAGPGTTIFNAANSYSGETDINAGTLVVNTAPSTSSGTYYVGNGGATTTAAALYLGGGSSGGVSLNNGVSENAGSGSNRIIGGNNTAGTDTYSGPVTINDSNANFRAASGGTVAFNTVTGSTQQFVTVGDGGYNGTVAFTGTSDNANIGATVNSGTLLLAKTNTGSGVHAIDAGLNVNSGGTVMLGGSGGDQIYNFATVTLNGGTFQPNGNSEGTGSHTDDGGVTHTGSTTAGMGALTLTANSILDFAGGAATLTFASFSDPTNAVLNIINYTTHASAPLVSGTDGTDDRLIFVNGPVNVADFTFAGTPALEINLGDGYEIVPVPEPSTWFAAVLAIGAMGFTQGRRVTRLLPR
jgi:autotransporter-associated beta strand protein